MQKIYLSSLVETYLPGKEYSVGIFKDNITGLIEAMPIEIIVKKNLNGHYILDFDTKRNDEEKVVPVIDAKIFNQLSKLATKAFVALKGKSFGRIDFKMDHLGIPHFIEANLMPGLRKGYFYRSCVLNLIITNDQNDFKNYCIHLTKKLKQFNAECLFINIYYARFDYTI